MNKDLISILENLQPNDKENAHYISFSQNEETILRCFFNRSNGHKDIECYFNDIHKIIEPKVINLLLRNTTKTNKVNFQTVSCTSSSNLHKILLFTIKCANEKYIKTIKNGKGGKMTTIYKFNNIILPILVYNKKLKAFFQAEEVCITLHSDDPCHYNMFCYNNIDSYGDTKMNISKELSYIISCNYIYDIEHMKLFVTKDISFVILYKNNKPCLYGFNKFLAKNLI